MAPTLSALTVALFGISSLLAGLTTLVSPTTLLATVGLPSEAQPAILSMGLAATAMGIYYLLAAYQDNRAFYVATVPMRLLTTGFFWAQGGRWREFALWEGLGAVLTAGAVMLEAGRGDVELIGTTL